MGDNQLLHDIAIGNSKAFEKLYNGFSDKVYNIALSYSKNVEDAEEITQEVFLKIYKHAASFNNQSSLSTWIYRIVVNTSLNYLKKKNRFTSFKSDYKDTGSIESIDFHHPGARLEQKENASILFKVIDCLPERQKTAFILSYIEWLPRQEVADIMRISLKSIESLLQRAKQNLRTRLTEMYPDRRKLKKELSKNKEQHGKQ